MAHDLPGFKGLKRCIRYIDNHPKTIFHPSCPYEGSNMIGLTRSGYQVKDHTNQNYLKLYQYEEHASNMNRRQ